MPNVPADFFTWNYLATLAGASAAVIVVTNTVQNATKRSYPLLPLIVSMVIAFGTAWHATQMNDLSEWALAFLNSCLLYCTATGANERVFEISKGQAPGAKLHGAKPTGWISSWIRRDAN